MGRGNWPCRSCGGTGRRIATRALPVELGLSRQYQVSCAALAKRGRERGDWQGERHGARSGEAWHAAIVQESDHAFCVHTGSPRQRSPPPFPAFKSYGLGFVQVSGIFCSSAEDFICTSRYTSGAKPCTPLACRPPLCCLLPSSLRRLPELWWAWTEFANRCYVFKECSYKESFCVFWHNWSFSPCDCLFLICSNTPCAPLSSVWQLGVVIKYLITVWMEGTGSSLC